MFTTVSDKLHTDVLVFCDERMNAHCVLNFSDALASAIFALAMIFVAIPVACLSCSWAASASTLHVARNTRIAERCKLRLSCSAGRMSCSDSYFDMNCELDWAVRCCGSASR
jgi:hypothetical protein